MGPVAQTVIADVLLVGAVAAALYFAFRGVGRK